MDVDVEEMAMEVEEMDVDVEERGMEVGYGDGRWR